MVWLNTQHSNVVSPKGVYGGSMCTCLQCRKDRITSTARRFPTKKVVELKTKKD